jgi:hypothetical protein
MSDNVRRVSVYFYGDRGLCYENHKGSQALMPWEEYERLRARIEEQNRIIKEYCLEEKTGEYLLGRIEELEELVELNQVRRLDRRHEHIIPNGRIDRAMEYMDLACANEKINLAECGLRPLMRTLLFKLGIVTDRGGCGWRMKDE